MSKIAYVSSLLADLNSYNPQTNLSEGPGYSVTLDPKSLATDIATTILTDTPDTDYDYVASLLFHQENNILKFLKANITTKDLSIRAAQNILLEFILSFIQKVKSIVQPHLKSLQQCCSVLGVSGAVVVRIKAIDVLIGLVKSTEYLDSTSLDYTDMFEKFSFQLRLPITTVPNSVKGAILELLGNIAKYNPDKVGLLQAKLLARNCTNMLSYELNESKKSDYAIIAGALNGLSALLSTDQFDTDTLSIDVKMLYQSVKTVLNIPEELGRYAPPIAALELFIEHASLFGPYLVQDYRELYGYFLSMCGHRNRDIEKLGYRALEQFFKQIGEAVAQRTGSQQTAAFNFFVGKFINFLQQDNAELDFQQFSISVRGIGYFAKASKHFLSADESKFLQDQLITRGTWIYSEASANQEKLTSHLPSFIQAYTQFIQQYDSPQPALLSIIYKMADSFILSYTHISTYTRQPGIFAIQSLISTLYSKGQGYLRHFLSNFFYNALICTCNDSSVMNDVIGNEEQTFYKELMHFWKSIFNNRYRSKRKDSDSEYEQQIHTILYDTFLTAVLRMVDALNLNVTRVEDGNTEDTSSNTERSSIDYANTVSQNLAPINQKDFTLYQNLVDFWCSLLPELDNRRLSIWLPIAGTSLIQSSTQKPLVSGFYRMLATLLAIAHEVQLFHGLKEKNLSKRSGRYQKKDTLDEAYQVFYDYLHQVWHRMKQFKDELLVACLRLILSCPLEFFEIRELILPLQSALRFGLTYAPMATIALNTLESLVDVDSPTHVTDEVRVSPLDTKRQLRTSKAARRTERIHRQFTKDELGVIEDEDAKIGLHDTQMRILRFLGRLGGANKMMLQTPVEDNCVDMTQITMRDRAQSQLVTWDPDRQLSVHIPFPNAGVQLPLAELLPRICELSESSPDRKIKVAACEFLHAVVLMMIGNSAFQARDRNAVASKYHQIYKRVFPVLIRLAIDLDQITRDIFRTLVAQIIHWLTNNAQYENPETVILLQTCLEAACGGHAALRDYGASCLQEFVKWSIKQTNAKANQSPMNMKSLFKRLYHLTLHPNPTKRLGASLIFNHIYRLFREEQPLVDEYTLELLYHFLSSLRSSENDHPSTGTQHQTKESISHLSRIIRVKSTLFMYKTSSRRPFPGKDVYDLPSVVEWCFQESGKQQREYAKSCMNLFGEFVMILPNVKDSRDWITQKLASDSDYLTKIYAIPNVRPENHLDVDWLIQLDCVLDGYTWLLERNIMTVSTCPILRENKNGVSLADACVYCLRSKPDSKGVTGDTLKKQAFQAYSSYRTVCLLNSIMGNGINGSESSQAEAIKMIDATGLLSLSEFATVVATMLLLPHQTADTIQMGQLSISTWISVTSVRHTAIELVKFIQRFWPVSALKKFCAAMADVLSLSHINPLMLDVHYEALQDMIGAMKGVKQLQEMGVLDQICKEWHNRDPASGPTSSDAFCQALFDKFINLQQIDDPNLIDLVGSMIQVAFHQPDFADSHAQELLGCATNSMKRSNKERLTIYQRYAPYINSCIANKFKSFSSYFIEHLDNHYILQIITGLFDYLITNKSQHLHENREFTNAINSSVTFLEEIRRHWGNLENYASLVMVMKGIFGTNAAVFMQHQISPAYGALASIMEHLLDISYPLSIKIEAFDLLPFFLQVQGPHTAWLAQSLKNIVNTQFPVSFSSLTPGSAIFNDSVLALDKLLTIMSNFHSVLLFNALLPAFMQDSGSLYQETIAPHISNFGQGLGLQSFETISQMCFDYFKDTSLFIDHRMKAVDLVIDILKLVPRNYVINFFKANIVYIMGIIKQEDLRRGTDEEIIRDLRDKAQHALYELLPVKQVHSPESKISIIWEQAEQKPSNGRKMTIDLVSQAHQAKSKQRPQENNDLSTTRLLYQQTAYNAAASAILRTQKSEKFFVGFLFQEKPTEPLWENILDFSMSLNLTTELKQPLLKTRVEDFRASSGLKQVLTDTSTPVHMASVGIAGSSLSQASLSQIASEALGQIPSPQQTQPSNQSNELDDFELEEGETTRGTLELELDPFNSNPCMKLITMVINRLHSSITPPTEDPSQMPMWMLEIHKAFTSSKASLVQQLFLAKLIVNSPVVFEVYAKFWIQPLMQLAMRGNEYGEPINYFVMDLCVIIIAWGKMVPFNNDHNDRYFLFKFVRYLSLNSFHEDSRVLRNNIQIVKGVFDNWTNHIIVPTKPIYQGFSSPDMKSRRNLLGLQLAGIVLAHGLELYYDGPEVELEGLTETEFYSGLFVNFAHRSHEVCASAAEVIAWSLTTMKRHNRSDQIVTEIQNHLMKMISKHDPTVTNAKSPANFLSLLNRLHLHDNELCRPFLSRIYFLLPQLVDMPLTHALEIINGCADQSADTIFQELQGKGLLRIISFRNDTSQLAVLKLLNKLAPIVTSEQVEYILNDLRESFDNHSNQDCRDYYYRFLQGIFDRFKETKLLGDEIKVQLLRGLIDDSEFVRNSISVYLEKQSGMTNDVYERAKLIIKEMYMAPVEDIYITYGTQMLLRATTDSYEYDKPIFDDPLPNAHFDEHLQDINTSWRRNISMTPLFVASQDQQQMTNETLENRLRQTQQTLEFSQTQAGTGASLMSTFGGNDISSTYSVETSLSQGAGSQREDYYNERQQQYAKLRRRYVQSTSGSAHAFYTRRQERLKKNLQKYMSLQKQMREKKVTMHRKYRVGELPDIQITYKEMVEPLQTLGRYDASVARLLHTHLVVTIGSNAESVASKPDYKSEIASIVANNLALSTIFSPPTVGSFLQILYEFGDCKLTSDLIKMASERSSNHRLGIAVLERQIRMGSSVKIERPLKRPKNEGSNTKLHASREEWIELATIYQDIEEPEIFQSLYRSYVATKELPKKAVDAKMRGDIALSCNLFQEAMVNHSDDADHREYELWAKESLRCFEQLTQWDDVSYHVINDLSGDLDRIWDKEFLVPYLHYFLRSNIKLRKGVLDENNNLIPWTADNPNPVRRFLQAAIQSKDKLDYLIDNHAAELALDAVSTNDFDRAHHYIRQSYRPLHSNWITLHPLAKTSRMQNLAQLQKIVELEEALDLVKQVQRKEVDHKTLIHYIRTLEARNPHPQLDGMDLWDDVIDSRMVFMDVLSLVLGNNQSDDRIQSLFVESRKTFLLEMISAARQQNNFNVAIDRWQRLLQLGNVEQYQRNYAFITIELQRSVVTDEHAKQSQMIARTLGSVLSYKMPDRSYIKNSNFPIEFHITAGKVMEVARSHLRNNNSAYDVFQSNKNVAKQLERRQHKDVNDFISYLTLQGYHHLQSAYTMTAGQSTLLEAECLWKFGEYCDNVLRSNEEQSDGVLIAINTSQYCQTVINNFFRAIQLGNRQAVERFPRLLELIEKYPSTGEDFKLNAEDDSASWYYIRWIPQLVAILDKPIAKFVFPIVIKLAQEYPTALYYPFQLSNEHYECFKEALDPANRQAIMKIKELIRSPLMETFTSELRRLTNPEHIVKDFIDFVMSIGDKADVNNTFLNDSYHQFAELLLNPTDSRLGTIPKAFAVKHASQLRELLGKNGAKLRNMSNDQRNKLLKYYQTKIQNEKLPGAPELLRSYSPWLANFQITDCKEKLEVPGQYHGRSRPDPESHVKIANFDERLLVMSSLRKPKRLRIYGTDGNEYLFLVKGGEDLRLDQRVQQLFVVMNELIWKEPYCAKHDIRLTTYNVIPMATNLGMIEWVQDTIPLRNCFEEQLNNRGLLIKVQESYRRFVSRMKGDVMGYHNLFQAPRDIVVSNFQQQTGSFQDDIIKQYLMKLASAPETFIFMRNNFAHSLGAICIAGYLLGIGDRHLENILVDKKNGTLLAIDFGHAFGSATELLPVPEMVPFRLTRQLVGALEPLGIEGILEGAMVHTLEAIQRESQILLNVMDVFVKEPLLDWKKVAAKQAKAQKRVATDEVRQSNSSEFMGEADTATGPSKEYEWYPQQKVETARKKLDGVNPAVIIREELERGHGGKRYLKGLLHVVKGVPEVDARARAGQRCQNTLEQVQCLINLATDPNILGRTWAGWQSFI